MTVNKDALQEYTNSIRRLKEESSESRIGEDEFQKMYFESLDSITQKHQENSRNQRPYRKYSFAFIVTIVIFVAIYNYRSIYRCLSCNIQEYIYPGLRLLRKLSIPLISLFPSITDLYHETCLIQNPFFTVVDMDCWPCSHVNSIQESHDKLPDNQQVTPFMYQTDQEEVRLETLREMYNKNREVFDQESPKVLKDSKYHVNPEEMFETATSGVNSLYVWKFYTMNIARILRQIVPRPKAVPKFGQSTERFIIIDSSQSSFRAPDTECNYSFLLMLSGTRTIHLMPAEECKHQCKMLKVNLKESYLLWYNWWYWRPVIQSSNGNDTMIAHIGSYC